jgi:hypothetical protein
MNIFKNLLILLASMDFCFAEIVSIESFAEVNEIDSQTLVVFDVDEVLITPEDLVLRVRGFRSKYHDEITPELLSIALSETKYELVDPNAAKFIQDLQQRGIKTIALTRARTGKFGVIDCCAEWRIKQLSNLNIDFSKSFSEVPPMVFSEGEHPALYKQGILFVGDAEVSKGELLGAFFDRIGFHPKKVIFFDDQMKNLKSVEKELNDRDIAYQGFYFEALKDDVIDVETAEKQLQHLIEKKKWLPKIDAKIQVVDSLKPIELELAKCSEDTLVLLDIGGTLLMHKDAILDAKHEEWKRKWFARHYPNSTRDDIVSSVRVVESAFENWKLVDEKWPLVISKAQQNNAKVVALTKVIVDPTLKKLRPENLKRQGVLLKDDLRGLAQGNFYEYAEGIIETEAKLKGPVLLELLPKLKDRPTKIIFVDDRLEQVRSVEEACQALKIPCVGFHYTASKKHVAELDEKVADYQLHTLMKEGRWVSESQAKANLTEANY